MLAERILGDLEMELSSAEMDLSQAKDEHKRGLLEYWRLVSKYSYRDALQKAVYIAKDNIEEGV